MKRLSSEKSPYSSLLKRLVKFWKRVDFLFLLIFVLAFAVRFHYATDFIMNDEVGGGYRGYGYLAWGYFDTAKEFHGYLSRVDFTGLYNWGLNHNANYPVVPFSMSVAILLTNSPTLAVARLPIEVSGALLAAFIYLLGRDLISKFAGLVSGLFAALDPVLIAYSRVAYLDVPLELFFVISVFTLYHGLTRRSTLSIAFSGIACSLAVLSKIMGWVLLPFALFLLLLWSFLNGERYSLLARNFTIFIFSFAFVLLVAFPWVGYEVVTGKYFSWFSSVSPTFLAPTSFVGPTSITVFMLGKLTPVELFTFGLGIIAVVWQFFRAKNKSSVIVVVSWFFVAFSSLELLSVKLDHYMVFLIPPILLLSGYGVLGCGRIVNKFISMSGKFGSSQKLIKRPMISSVALLLLVGGVQFFTIVQYYPYFSLYSSPLVGDPFQTFFVHGEEGIPAVVDFLRNHVPDGSTIAVAGQVHLFAYYLPEYKIVGLSEFYPFSDEPIAFLYLSGIKYLVVQMGFRQMFEETDPVLLKLSQHDTYYVSNIRDNNLIWIYDFSGTYQTLSSNILEGEWRCFQGNFSEGSPPEARTLAVGEGFSYVYAIRPIGNITARSSIVFAWEISNYTVSSFRVEIYFNGKHSGNIYPLRKIGLWTSASAVLQEQGELELVIVAEGAPGQFLELRSIALLSSD